ncbi:DinB family protein [Rhizobium sp. C4]|uniref:DinB family protein n=1 Tax=Rhizobium sp. C4 TaxID=1349800 RepID=UPI001E2E1AA8|nr:DinB family protein [Rhizobium sp. C4]MCD2174796.1 DinB family protein [Rhizobium sp. C4]
MSIRSVLTSLFEYKASAGSDLLDSLADVEQAVPQDKFHRALRILNHAHIVDRIFLAHLQGQPHGFTASWQSDAPAVGDLAKATREVDQNYLAHLNTLDDEALDEEISFTFTDGQSGRMTRAEMLLHVATHSGYHRGEAGSHIPEVEAASMRDVFAGYLHRAEPARRQRSVTS